MARVCAVFFKFQRDGGQGEKEMARIVKEKTKLRKKKIIGGQRTAKNRERRQQSRLKIVQ